MSIRNKNQKTKSGFTIIEVVLVLAIAGLVFLMVFIALPALNAAQRDKQRKNDATIIAAAVRSYMANNHGNPPKDGNIVLETEGEGDNTSTRGSAGSSTDAAFAKYLVDLDAGGVTGVISIFDLALDNKTAAEYFSVNGSSESVYADNVWILPGVKCPEEGNEIKYNIANYFKVTHHRSDVVIVRYLERGGWYCLEV